MLDQPLLGIASESLKAVDGDTAAGEVRLVIYAQVTVVAEHQGIVDPVAVGVNDITPPHFLHGQTQHGRSLHVGHHRHLDPIPCALSAEVGFVQLNFPAQESVPVRSMDPDGRAQGVDGAQGGVVGKRGLLGHLTHRQLQFERFADAQPLLGGQRAALQPPFTEIVEGKAAKGAAPSSVSQAIESAMTAVRTKSVVGFFSKIPQAFPPTGFSPNQGFIRAEVHKVFKAFGPKLKQLPNLLRHDKQNPTV